jgi:hypothetical protein
MSTTEQEIYPECEHTPACLLADGADTPCGVSLDAPAVGFYASIERGSRHGLLLGPYPTRAEASSHVDEARRLAGKVDSFTAFDGFGVTRAVARPGHELPKGRLNAFALVTS